MYHPKTLYPIVYKGIIPTITKGVKYQYPDTYDGTFYNHHTFDMYQSTYYFIKNRFKINENDTYFINKYKLKYSVDYDHILNCLYDYYCNLNTVLNRYKHTCSDLLLTNLANNNFIFNYQDRMTKLTACWDDIFLPAFLDYKKNSHLLYDESYGISYKMFFDNNFFICLIQHLYDFISRRSLFTTISSRTFEIMRKEKVYINNTLTEDEVIDLNLLYEIPECLQTEFQTLLFQDASVLVLTTE